MFAPKKPNSKRPLMKTKPYDREVRRMRYLPEQLRATYKKLEMLENEARRYGMNDLVRTRYLVPERKNDQTQTKGKHS